MPRRLPVPSAALAALVLALALASPSSARAQDPRDPFLVLAAAGSTVLLAGEVFYLVGDAVQLARPYLGRGWSFAEIAWGIQNTAFGIAALGFRTGAWLGIGVGLLTSGALHLTHAIVLLVLHANRPPPVTMDIGLREGGAVLGVAGRW